MSAWDGLNRRRFPRVFFPCLIKVHLKEDSPETMLTHTDNIGVGGVCVTVKKSIKLSTPVSMEIDLMDTGDHIKCEGKVVWSVRRKETDKKKPLFYDVGVEFGDISEKDKKRLDVIVARLAKQGKIVPMT